MTFHFFYRYIPDTESMFKLADIYDSTSFDVTLQSFWYSADKMIYQYLDLLIFSPYRTLFKQNWDKRSQ